MLVPNKTRYHNEFSKIVNSIPDTDSFEFESNKRNGYFQRLYFEYLYTQKVNGTTFFFTFTYNDKSIPKYLGHNVFSYDDIRYITNGALPKRLLRHYNASLKYFCACESGEGKGKRGIGNNPHYHFIFFVQPANSEYKPISPKLFYSWLRELWLGSDKYLNYKDAKYGIVKEGKLGSVVTSPSAFKYCAKYCIKDSYQKSVEYDIRKYFYDEIIKSGIDLLSLYNYYKYYEFDKYEFWKEFGISSYHSFLKSHPDYPISDWLEKFMPYGSDTLNHFKEWYNSWYVPHLIDVRFTEFRNKYSGKVRCSKLLGQYGIQFIKDRNSNPHFLIPNGTDGYIIQKPSLFYIRHLFYETFICEHSGNVLYRLNDDGIQLKMNQIEKSIESYKNKTLENISFVVDNNYYIPYKGSDLNCSDLDSYIDSIGGVFSSKDCDLSLSSLLSSLISESSFKDIIHRYSIYHNIYQYRLYLNGTVSLTEECLSKDYLSDYYEFLLSSVQLLDYDDSIIYSFYHRQDNYDILTHPAFLPYKSYFDFLDSLNTEVFKFKSEVKRKKFNDSSEHQKRLNAYNINSSHL